MIWALSSFWHVATGLLAVSAFTRGCWLLADGNLIGFLVSTLVTVLLLFANLQAARICIANAADPP